MPRRKGHGIPPTKRVKQPQPEAISRSAPLKNKLYNEIPVVIVKEEPLQMTVNTVPIKSEPILSDALHSKYLHKKFKKMASTLLPEDTNNMLNGSRFKRVSDFINEADRVISPPKTEIPIANSRVTSPPAGRYVCSYCKLACAKPSVLQKHIRAHTNERPYPCEPCGFAFKTKSNLYKHCRSRAHAAKLEETGEKPPVFDGEEAPTSEEDDCRSNVSNAASTTSKTEDTDSKDEMPKSIYKPKYRFMDQPTLNASQNEKSDDIKENSRSPPKLQLKIPVPNSSPFVTTPSPFTSGSSPSPELIHRHISKLISENQAIIETNDPFWTKKFLQRANSNENSSSSPLSTSPSPLDAKKISRLSSSFEAEDPTCDKSPAKQSRLALALLRPQTSPSPVPTDISDAQPLNLSTSSKEAQNRKRSYSEGFPEQAVRIGKSQVSIIPTKIKNNSVQDFRRFQSSFSDNHASSKDIMGNSQNPEGSIIKDLLLKARATGITLMGPVVDVPIMKPMLSLTPPVSDDRAYSPSSQLMCHLCKEPVGYRNAESLEIHQLYHCKGDDGSSRSSLNSPSPKSDNHYLGSPYRKSSVKESSMIMAPSPGPHLGSTPLVESYRTRSPLDTDASPIVLKKRKFDTGTIETRVISASTLRTLEELSKSPMRSNLQMFGGEVKIIDSPVAELNTIRIESSNRSLAPSDIPHSNKIIIKEEREGHESPSNVFVKIAKQGLHSGGSILQVPHKTAVEPSAARLQVVARSPVHYQEPKPMMLPMVPPNHPGITSSVHLPFIPFTSILPETTGINPLTNITAYNPLTLPPAPLIPPTSPGMALGMPSPYSSGIVTILHGGKEIPYVPGMPGPHSLLTNHSVPVYSTSDIKSYERRSIDYEARSVKNEKLLSLSNNALPTIKVTGDAADSSRKRQTPDESHHSSSLSPTPKRSQTLPSSEESTEVSPEKRFLRPTSLPLKPGTFVPKRQQVTPVLSLVSPETPRPRKSYGQLYLNGHAYTYLGLKCSTRMFFCTLNKPQPLYVPLSPEHNKVSMYSNWKVCTEADPNPFGLDPGHAMALYDSRHRPATYTLARSRNCEAVTHSTYWTSRPTLDHTDKEVKEGEAVPKRVKIFAGGFESNEDYIYVRGRGRGRYVCEECGIRCKKPSMLKKHIRTHTDVRPFTCTHCTFSFKTKGNLTKHMKSKAHYKKCVDLGISPVPTTVDDSCVDEAALAHQQALRENHGVEPDESEEDEEDEDDDTEDEEEDEEEVEGEGEGEDWQAARSLLTLSETIQSATQRQHASSGLVAVSPRARPITYPYSYTGLAHTEPQTPTLTAISAQREREKVSQNTGLAREVQVQGDGKTRGREAVEESQGNVGDKGVAARYYFPSSHDLGDSGTGTESGSGGRAKQSTPIDLSNKPVEPAPAPRESEAALLLALCSTMERLPISTTGAVTMGEDSALLQAYLTERAMHDSRIKQHQYRHRPVAPVELPMTAATGLNIHAAKENARGILAQTSSDAARKAVDDPPTPTTGTNKPQAEFLLPSSGPSPSYVSLLEDGRSMCNICNKVFSKPSQLRLHVNIHYFERPYRCEACAVSFRTKGHLQKHMRSVSHLNKVSMNSTFGTATTTNPRPFKCDDCKIAFRIHGHLAKHLRSKMHIMKLECLGKLPFGTYAEMERSGVNMNDIDTTDCENSLESLQLLAHKLYEKDPSKLGQWEPNEMMPHHTLSSGDTSSEGEDEDMPLPLPTALHRLPPPPPTSPSEPLKCVINIRNHKGPKHKPEDEPNDRRTDDPTEG